MGEESKKITDRFHFGIKDAIIIFLLLAISSGVFVWSYFSVKISKSASYLEVNYNSEVILNNLEVISPSLEEREYILSFRRQLKQGETYYNPSSYEESNIQSLKEIKDYSSINGKYLILNGFSLLYGPQVDLQVKQGKISIIRETSPHNICSKQGEVSFTNLPVVCLPNYLMFAIKSNSDSIRRPDA